MVSIEDFAIPQGWKHTSWTPELADQPGREPFVVGGALLIGIANADKTECHVAWLDTQGLRWSIHGLPFLPEDGRLEGETFVICEATEPQLPIALSVGIRLDNSGDVPVITGTLRNPKSGPVDGPVGTFTAEANPRPLGGGRATG